MVGIYIFYRQLLLFFQPNDHKARYIKGFHGWSLVGEKIFFQP